MIMYLAGNTKRCAIFGATNGAGKNQPSARFDGL